MSDEQWVRNERALSICVDMRTRTRTHTHTRSDIRNFRAVRRRLMTPRVGQFVSMLLRNLIQMRGDEPDCRKKTAQGELKNGTLPMSTLIGTATCLYTRKSGSQVDGNPRMRPCQSQAAAGVLAGAPSPSFFCSRSASSLPSWMRASRDYVLQSGTLVALMTNVLGLVSKFCSHHILAACRSHWHACLASWQPARRVVEPSVSVQAFL